MGKVVGLIAPPPRRALASLITSFLLSTAFLGSILISSGGAEPRGVCVIAEGRSGLLPLNPLLGAPGELSCDLNYGLVLIYILGPAIVLFAFAFVLLSIIAWVLMLVASTRNCAAMAEVPRRAERNSTGQ